MFFQVCGLQDSVGGQDKPSTSLAEQVLWLISLRWMAVALVVVGALSGTLLFPVLTTPLPLYVVAGVLLACNILYAVFARDIRQSARPRQLILAMVQIEIDLLILTIVLFFSGGVMNPFFLFYVFHVIIATIILPRNFSFVVGLTSIALFGLLAANELHGGAILGYYPLQLSAGGGLWRNPVYGLAGFVAFAFTVVLAQYLTHMIITRMTMKELEAARNRDLLQAIINAMAEGLMFVTAEGRLALCNPAAEHWRTGQWVGDPEAIGGFPEALVEEIQSRSGPSSDRKWGEKIEFNTDGPTRRSIEARGYSVVGVDGEELGHVIVGQDLTARKQLEADLLERTEQLTAINETLRMSRVRMAQREKMVALGQMAAGIAHEIGNPLASLSGVAQYLGRKCMGSELKEMCGLLDHHVGRISAILKRMLRLAKPASAEYRWVDIHEVIDNTLSLVKFDKRTRDVAITHSCDSKLPMVWLDPQNLEQCLLNVVINALDAMDAKRAEDCRLELGVAAVVQEETVEIRVSDTGIGMSPEVCRHAFESFFTTKEISKGTGLGLFVSYNLLAEIDGTIELDSKLGQGTTVIMRIPVRPKKDLIGASERQTS